MFSSITLCSSFLNHQKSFKRFHLSVFRNYHKEIRDLKNDYILYFVFVLIIDIRKAFVLLRYQKVASTRYHHNYTLVLLIALFLRTRKIEYQL